MDRKTFHIIGLMSGTSLDGLDVALCEFICFGKEVESFKILKAETYPYSENEKRMLSLMSASAIELASVDFHFGKFCGEKVAHFLQKNDLEADFVASHGHTIFHQPEYGFTTQIGNGGAISAACGLPVVSDFRSMDVALGGQGAPLVPIGDLLLFKDFTYCLNLGGIANISIKKESHIVAFDVCPANMALNYLAKEKRLEYDKNGDLARKGSVNHELLTQLNELDFYSKLPPKSLGKEYVASVILPLLDAASCSTEDKLATVCEHIAEKIAIEVSDTGKTGVKILTTGGGAFNSYLIETIQRKLSNGCEIFVPDEQLVSFKEALVFAFLGLFRIWNVPNALQSVTGARNDNIGGALYGDFSHLP